MSVQLYARGRGTRNDAWEMGSDGKIQTRTGEECDGQKEREEQTEAGTDWRGGESIRRVSGRSRVRKRQMLRVTNRKRETEIERGTNKHEWTEMRNGR